MDLDSTYEDSGSELTELSDDEDELDPSPPPTAPLATTSKRKAFATQSRQRTVHEYKVRLPSRYNNSTPHSSSPQANFLHRGRQVSRS